MGVCIFCEKDTDTECECGKKADQRLRDAVQRRNEGIEKSGKHADRKSHEWIERAVDAMAQYIQVQGEAFLVEEFRVWAAQHVALLDPPDGRAWGAVTTVASRRGLIVKAGSRPATSSNLSLKWTWQVARE